MGLIQLSSSLANHQIVSSRFDNIHGQGLEAINCKYAFHLGQQANEQAEIATGESKLANASSYDWLTPVGVSTQSAKTQHRFG